jgi:anti-sigma B factor antagonist
MCAAGPVAHRRRVANQLRSGDAERSRSAPSNRYPGHQVDGGSASDSGAGADASAVAVVHLIGEIDSFTGTDLEWMIGRELASRPPGLIVDLSLVGFLGSSALAILCRVRDLCFRQGTELALVGVGREDVLQRLRIAGLERLPILDA